MQNQQPKFNRNKLVMAVSLAMLGGSLAACNNSNPDAPPPPPPAAAAFTLTTAGGNGGSMLGGDGGEGGGLHLYNEGGTGGVQVLSEDAADTSFTTPVTPAAVNLGTNPLTIAADTTIDYVAVVVDGGGTVATENYVGTDGVLRTAAGATAVYATDAIVAAGTNYLTSSSYGLDYKIYMSDGTAAADVAYTGLSVAAGATLTLDDNSGCSSNVRFSDDVENNGTITKATKSCSITLFSRSYFAAGNIVNAGIEDFVSGGSVTVRTSNAIVNSGLINTSGFDEADEFGGNGGEISLDSDGYILNSGMLDTNGGDGNGNGGSGGSVYMYAAYTENTGGIDTHGGSNISNPAIPGSGGSGGYVELDSDFVTNNRAAINTSGGNGSSGGSGGTVDLSNDSIGFVLNAGSITATGGNGNPDNGGSGGEFVVDVYGGDFVNSGDITTAGGDSAGTSNGGWGGEFYIDTYSGDRNEPAGSIVISGNIDGSGGNALATGDREGGWGAEIYADVNDAGGSDARVALLGYLSIDVSGGDGADGGEGAGGYASFNSTYFETSSGWDEETQTYTAGSVTNSVPIDATGGNSTATGLDYGDGGDGGEVTLSASTDSDILESESVSMATNSADINVSGGIGYDGSDFGYMGGEGGSVYMDSYHGTDNSGNITANGGNGTGEFGQGHLGGEVALESVMDVTNSGDFTANGGDGTEYAGPIGGQFFMFAEGNTTNSGTITVNGGTGGMFGGEGGIAFFGADGDVANSGGFSANGGVGGEGGGNAGFFGAEGATVSNTANLSVNGGNATETDLVTYDTFGGDGGEIGLYGYGIDTTTNSGSLSYLFGTGETNGDEGSATVGLTCEGNCAP